LTALTKLMLLVIAPDSDSGAGTTRPSERS
jgi:hypothetical protein